MLRHRNTSLVGRRRPLARRNPSLPRTAVPAAEALAKATIALPFFRDIQPAEIERVAGCLLSALEAPDQR